MPIEVAAWARARGMTALLPADFPAEPDIHRNPTIDFSRLIQRVPRVVVAPRDIEELSATVALLRARGLPWLARGTGHASGGQSLLEGGAIIDTRNLARIVADEGTTITVQGGILWLDVLEHLAATGRRPAVLTDNLRSTVGGTLSVGGIGETSHIEGLQIDAVDALTLVTPDGGVHHVGPGDDLFRFALAGHGQLGVIAEARLQTRPRPPHLAGRILVFPTLASYLAAAAERRYAFVRGRIFWLKDSDENVVQAVVGNFSDDVGSAPPEDYGGAAKASPAEVIDLVAHERRQKSRWPAYGPVAELALPLPTALEAWPRLNHELRAFGIPSVTPKGSSAGLLAPGRRLPLGLVPPGADTALVVALRPFIDDLAIARKVAVFFRAFSARAADLGARLYLIGEEPDHPGWLARQVGDDLPAWRALKSRLDPENLCHPWPTFTGP